MKTFWYVKILLFLTLPLLGNVGLALTPAEQLKREVLGLGSAVVTGTEYKQGLVKHLVLFRYKNTTSAEQRSEIAKRFLALQRESLRNGQPYIMSIEYGLQNSGEGADLGLQEGFIVTFKSEGDRNYYVGRPIITDPAYYEPAHQAFKDFVGPYINDSGDSPGAVVFDFCVGGLAGLRR